MIRKKFGHADYPTDLYKIHILKDGHCEHFLVPCDLHRSFSSFIKYRNAPQAINSY